MKPQDRERARLVYPRAEVLLPALDALVVAAGLIALRPALEVQASGHAPGLLLADAYALTWTLAGFLFGLTFLLGCHRAGHYDRRRPRWHEIGDIVGFALLLGSIDLGLSLIGGIDPRIPVGVWLLLAVLVPLGRAGLRRRLDALGLWRRPTVVVGVGDNAERAAQALMREPGLGLAIVAFADPTEGRLLAGGGIRPVPRMISLGDELRPVLPLDRLLGEITSNLAAPHIVIAPDADEMPACIKLFESLAAAGRDVDFFPPFGGLPVAAPKLARLIDGGAASIRLKDRLSAPLGRFYKRAFDLVVGTAICVFAAPLIVVLAAAILFLDGRPVFFFQRRIGMHGRPFPCLKFRTMVPDAEVRLQALLESDPAARAEWQRDRKLRNDPRVSRVGAWLRRTSLDELPQLFNVIRGEMSLIGPRPVVEEELRRYGPRAVFYLKTRPGLSGLWQVSGRNDLDYGHRVQLDCQYVRNWSPWWDVALLLATVRAVFTRRGAY